jgi:catechol 2,3-dioxygenase-like lactoylglutathione lyase family enzyme
MNQIKIEHSAIKSSRTEYLAKWYCDLFNFEVVDDNKKGNYFIADSFGQMIEFVLASDNDKSDFGMNRKGIYHLAFKVDDINEFYERVKDKSPQIISPPAETMPGVWTCFFLDPDDNLLHVVKRNRELC